MRPSMNFIYNIMKKLDSMINKEPIKPLKKDTLDSNKYNNKKNQFFSFFFNLNFIRQKQS